LRPAIVVTFLLGAALLAHPRPIAAQIDLPPPRGHVNDFADVISPEHEARIEALVQQVKARCGGEIVVVTLPSLQGHSRDEVALQIGREWKVGGTGEGGDTLDGTGTVLLVIPSEHQWRIELGTRTATFITTGEAGEIGKDAMVPHFRSGDFGTGILRGVEAVAERYAAHYGFALEPQRAAEDSPPSSPAATADADQGQPHYLLGFVVLVILAIAGAVLVADLRRTKALHFAPRPTRRAYSRGPQRRRVGIRRLADRQSVGAEWLISPDFEFGFGASASPGDSTHRRSSGDWSGGDSSSGAGSSDSSGRGFSGDGAGGDW
jgi:uncharacterized protein